MLGKIVISIKIQFRRKIFQNMGYIGWEGNNKKAPLMHES